jgi:hypothetical protein
MVIRVGKIIWLMLGMAKIMPGEIWLEIRGYLIDFPIIAVNSF